MKLCFKFILWLLPGMVAMVLCCMTANATVWPVSQNGGGSTNSMAWANSNLYSPGDTLMLEGTITNALTLTVSGVTVLFSSNAMMSAPTLPQGSVWINVNNLSNWVVDGGVNGIIQLTDNGTPSSRGGTHAYSNPDIIGIEAEGIFNGQIRNMTILNMYNRQTNTENSQSYGGNVDACIYWTGSGLTVSNCYLSGSQNGCTESFDGVCSNFTLIGCTFSNYNHATQIATDASDTPIFNNITIVSNIFQSGDMYESCDTCDTGFHRNPIFFYGNVQGPIYPANNGYISNVVISHNYICHGLHPLSHLAGTGGIYIETTIIGLKVFNNVSTVVYPLQWSGGGGMLSGIGNNVLFANNTMIGWSNNGLWSTNGYAIGGTNVTNLNNIMVDANGVTFEGANTTTNYNLCTTNDAAFLTNVLSSVLSDYNVFNHFQVGDAFDVFVKGVNSTWGGALDAGWSAYTNLPSYWTGGSCGVGSQAYLGWFSAHCDPHSLTNLALLAANGQPLTNDTVAISNGLNLTAYGITTDFAGNARPATGAWTIGAYQVGTNAGTNYTLTTASSPSGGGTTSGGGSFTPGQTATVTATSNPGYGFTNWTDGGTNHSTNAVYSFAVYSNMTETAYFTNIPAPPVTNYVNIYLK